MPCASVVRPSSSVNSGSSETVALTQAFFFQNLSFSIFLRFYLVFANIWNPNGNKITKHYFSHNSGSISTKLYELNILAMG